MRNIILLASLFALLLASCSKEEPLFDEKGRGEGFAVLNGKEWKVETYALGYNPEKNIADIHLNVIDAHGIVRESLGFLNTKLQTGDVEIGLMNADLLFSNFGATYTTFIADGDVTGDRYNSPQSTGSEVLSIESYNEVSGEIYGTFTCKVAGTPNYDLSLPDTLHFEDGWFRVKIVE